MTDTGTTILAVDDSPATVEVIRRNLQQSGYLVFTAASVEEARVFLEDQRVDIVITDYKMPESNGLDLIRHIRDNYKDTDVIMITGYPSIAGAVEAMRDGAGEYLAKPFTADELLGVVQRMEGVQSRRRQVEKELPGSDAFGIIGQSKEMRQVFALIRKAAASSANVLVSGESGTGKELVARAIHYHGERCANAFVPVNCSAIPDGLLESELFGHVKGAFTGAKESRAGFFEIANGGTIFLDEIGDASPNLQAKLLRVMQNREFRMVGSSRIRTVDTRIIAATHKNLRIQMEQGLFREDLFYRVHVIEIRLPSLAERREDILSLATFFLQKYAGESARLPLRFSDAALDSLVQYSWPGNVRELENVIQRLVAICEGPVIDSADLPENMRFVLPKANGLHKTLAEVEGEYILRVLQNCGNNKTKAAEILGIDRKTLREKIKRREEDL